MFIEETTRTNKFISLEQPGPKRVTDKVMSQKIIDFEPGRKALKKNGFDDKQNPVTLMERSRVPFRLPEDWVEFLLTVVLFVGLLSGLVGGVYCFVAFLILSVARFIPSRVLWRIDALHRCSLPDVTVIYQSAWPTE